MENKHSPAYDRIEALLSEDQCVVLDGGVGSEITRRLIGGSGFAQAPGIWEIYEHTARVLDVHRDYALAGCDVISTNTWGLLGGATTERGRRPGRTGLPAWTAATRDAVRLARQGIAEAGRTGQCAVGFSLNDADPLLMGEQALLALLWSVDRPDLVLVETLAAVPSPELLQAITAVASTGLPVWVSFRRVGPPVGEEPGSFSSALIALDRAGVRAFLVNCIPVDRTAEALAELTAATARPVGCYPRLDEALHPAAYGDLSQKWWDQGARIIGGCCGVGPAHVAVVRERFARGAPTTTCPS
jgi:S-methylmethionine-dependent homocysteine/selenocysteine methylase